MKTALPYLVLLAGVLILVLSGCTQAVTPGPVIVHHTVVHHSYCHTVTTRSFGRTTSRTVCT